MIEWNNDKNVSLCRHSFIKPFWTNFSYQYQIIMKRIAENNNITDSNYLKSSVTDNPEQFEYTAWSFVVSVKKLEGGWVNSH